MVDLRVEAMAGVVIMAVVAEVVIMAAVAEVEVGYKQLFRRDTQSNIET